MPRVETPSSYLTDIPPPRVHNPSVSDRRRLQQSRLRALRDGDTLVVPYSKALVKDAPMTQGTDELTPTDEDRLYAHYDLAGDVLEA